MFLFVLYNGVNMVIHLRLDYKAIFELLCNFGLKFTIARNGKGIVALIWAIGEVVGLFCSFV